MQQTLNRNRAGKVSSSECYKIFESKTVQETYLQDVRIANLFKQSDPEKDVFNFKWGHLLENFLHNKTDYLSGYINQNYEDEPTIFSKLNDFHCGTPDQYTVQDDCLVVSETKSPATLKGFYNLIFPFYTTGTYHEVDGNLAIQQVIKNSKEGRKYHKQIISNAILLEERTGVECRFGELIAFMPYKSDIAKIIAYAEEYFDTEYYPILFGTSETLPCIKPAEKNEADFFDLEDRYPVKDFHRIRFDISDEEKENFKTVLKTFTDRI